MCHGVTMFLVAGKGGLSGAGAIFLFPSIIATVSCLAGFFLCGMTREDG